MEPFNAEPSADALVRFQRTPGELVYCRNHGPVKEFDEAQYRVNVHGGVKKPLQLTLHDLRTKYRKKEVVAALQVSLAEHFSLLVLTTCLVCW
jgi:sulfite oxidase